MPTNIYPVLYVTITHNLNFFTDIFFINSTHYSHTQNSLRKLSKYDKKTAHNKSPPLLSYHAQYSQIYSLLGVKSD